MHKDTYQHLFMTQLPVFCLKMCCRTFLSSSTAPPLTTPAEYTHLTTRLHHWLNGILWNVPQQTCRQNIYTDHDPFWWTHKQTNCCLSCTDHQTSLISSKSEALQSCKGLLFLFICGSFRKRTKISVHFAYGTFSSKLQPDRCTNNSWRRAEGI